MTKHQAQLISICKLNHLKTDNDLYRLKSVNLENGKKTAVFEIVHHDGAKNTIHRPLDELMGDQEILKNLSAKTISLINFLGR